MVKNIALLIVVCGLFNICLGAPQNARVVRCNKSNFRMFNSALKNVLINKHKKNIWHDKNCRLVINKSVFARMHNGKLHFNTGISAFLYNGARLMILCVPRQRRIICQAWK